MQEIYEKYDALVCLLYSFILTSLIVLSSNFWWIEYQIVHTSRTKMNPTVYDLINTHIISSMADNKL